MKHKTKKTMSMLLIFSLLITMFVPVLSGKVQVAEAAEYVGDWGEGYAIPASEFEGLNGDVSLKIDYTVVEGSEYYQFKVNNKLEEWTPFTEDDFTFLEYEINEWDFINVPENDSSAVVMLSEDAVAEIAGGDGVCIQVFGLIIDNVTVIEGPITDREFLLDDSYPEEDDWGNVTSKVISSAALLQFDGPVAVTVDYVTTGDDEWPGFGVKTAEWGELAPKGNTSIANETGTITFVLEKTDVEKAIAESGLMFHSWGVYFTRATLAPAEPDDYYAGDWQEGYTIPKSVFEGFTGEATLTIDYRTVLDESYSDYLFLLINKNNDWQVFAEADYTYLEYGINEYSHIHVSKSDSNVVVVLSEEAVAGLAEGDGLRVEVCGLIIENVTVTEGGVKKVIELDASYPEPNESGTAVSPVIPPAVLEAYDGAIAFTMDYVRTGNAEYPWFVANTTYWHALTMKGNVNTDKDRGTITFVIEEDDIAKAIAEGGLMFNLSEVYFTRAVLTPAKADDYYVGDWNVAHTFSASELAALGGEEDVTVTVEYSVVSGEYDWPSIQLTDLSNWTSLSAEDYVESDKVNEYGCIGVDRNAEKMTVTIKASAVQRLIANGGELGIQVGGVVVWDASFGSKKEVVVELEDSYPETNESGTAVSSVILPSVLEKFDGPVTFTMDYVKTGKVEYPWFVANTTYWNALPMHGKVNTDKDQGTVRFVIEKEDIAKAIAEGGIMFNLYEMYFTQAVLTPAKADDYYVGDWNAAHTFSASELAALGGEEDVTVAVEYYVVSEGYDWPNIQLTDLSNWKSLSAEDYVESDKVNEYGCIGVDKNAEKMSVTIKASAVQRLIANGGELGIQVYGVVVKDAAFVAITGESVEISEANFPDAVFRAYVSESFDLDGNGVLSGGEIAAVTTIQKTEAGIKSLQGIEYFTNLRTMGVWRNNIKILDLSENENLSPADCALNYQWLEMQSLKGEIGDTYTVIAMSFDIPWNMEEYRDLLSDDIFSNAVRISCPTTLVMDDSSALDVKSNWFFYRYLNGGVVNPGSFIANGTKESDGVYYHHIAKSDVNESVYVVLVVKGEVEVSDVLLDSTTYGEEAYVELITFSAGEPSPVEGSRVYLSDIVPTINSKVVQEYTIDFTQIVGKENMEKLVSAENGSLWNQVDITDGTATFLPYSVDKSEISPNLEAAYWSETGVEGLELGVEFAFTHIVSVEDCETVPESFKDEFSSVKDLEKHMKDAVHKKADKKFGKHSLYDAKMWGMDTDFKWYNVSPEEFPEEGIELFMPYPEGTDADTDFKIAHIFEQDCNGYKKGDIEYPEVHKEKDGIRFRVMGLSPIMLAYGEAESEVTLPVPEKPYKIANVVSGAHVYWNAVEGVTHYGVWRSETGKNGTYKWLGNPAAAHFTDIKAESGKTYFYKITSYDAATKKHSEMSEAIGIIYVGTPDITERANVASGIALGWQKVEGATGYGIYRKSYAGTDAWKRIATIEGNETFTYIDTSVSTANGTMYRYTIRALAGSDLKTLSGCRNTGRTMVRLSNRELSNVTADSSTSVKCTWSTSAQVTGYQIRFVPETGMTKNYTVGNYKTGTQVFTGLSEGTTYYVQVRSYKTVEDVGTFYSDWSEGKDVTLGAAPTATPKPTATPVPTATPTPKPTATPTPKPTATPTPGADVLPTPAKPHNITNVVSGVHVYWKAIAGVEKFGLWRSETGKDGTYKWIANPTVPHFTDTTVVSGKTYYYKVTAMDVASNTHGARSEAIGMTYVGTPDITSRENVTNGIALGWQKIDGATGYAIYRKSYDGADAWVRIATIEGNNTFTYTDTSVATANGTVYRYTIRALAGSNRKTLSGCRNTGRTMTRLTDRAVSSVTAVSATSAKCTWTTTGQATGYEVRFVAADGTAKNFKVTDYKTGTKTFTGLTSGTTYTVYVRSYKNVSGVGSFYSGWSAGQSVTMP